ncbi:MAG: alpha/beta hydrolase [Burkholderiales bacterium]
MGEGTFQAGQFEVDIEEVEYLRHGEKVLLARVFKPRGKGPFPAVVEMHGGAWCAGDRNNNDAINRPVASGGVVIAALDFRAPPDAIYPGSVADTNYGVRWLKANAARFNTRPEWVGAMGTSSGGHLAVLSGMKPNDARYVAIPGIGEVAKFDARIAFGVSLWPVICPQGRYRYAKQRQSEGNPIKVRSDQIKSQDRYWITEEAMGEGSPVKALQRGDKVETPDILYLQNPIDDLHPMENLQQFVEGYRNAGGKLQLELFEGAAYDLVRTAPDSAEAKRMVRKIVEFIHQHAR